MRQTTTARKRTMAEQAVVADTRLLQGRGAAPPMEDSGSWGQLSASKRRHTTLNVWRMPYPCDLARP